MNIQSRMKQKDQNGIFEQYWINNIHTIDYIESAKNWILKNYNELINPNFYLEDYVCSNELSKNNNPDLTQHTLHIEI